MNRILALVVALCLLCLGFAFGEEYAISDISVYGEYEPDLNRVFYEIFVGSFSDSDGDGTGDLRGIINRLDYLNDSNPSSGLSLGVEGIWLTPIFASNSYHKYDVKDYYSIDPDFGTMEDLCALIEACHARGMYVILDLVLNHTSSQNAWFKNFINAHVLHNTQNIYYDFYTWLDADEPTPAGRTFKVNETAGIKYECNFDSGMPELNYDNPLVREKMLDVAKYYIDLGIDGFRFDAAKYIYYGDTEKNVEFWQWYIGELKQLNPDIYTVAEVWDSDGITDRYTPALNCFNFTASQSDGILAIAAKGGNVNKLTSYVESYILRVKSLNSDAMNLMFLSNHDMDRAAGYLTPSSGNAYTAASLYILSPGSPFIYYGEEIGMKGSRGGASTDANRRLAMLWGDGDSVKNPIGATYTADKQTSGTVREQISDEYSLYNHYKRLIMIRNANPEIARGEYKALCFQNTNVGGFTATWQGSTVAVIHNTTSSVQTVDLASVTDVAFNLIAACAGTSSESPTLTSTTLTIPEQTTVVLRCE